MFPFRESLIMYGDARLSGASELGYWPALSEVRDWKTWAMGFRGASA